MEEIKIRKAVINDCDRLMEMMKELAKHEKDLHLMRLSAGDIRRDGFGENPQYGCLVAEISYENIKRLIGYALYYNTYSSLLGKCLCMMDFYVEPNQRGKGIGSRIFDEVKKVAYDTGCSQLQWGCNAWNKNAIDFYKRKGAIDITNPELLAFKIDRANLF